MPKSADKTALINAMMAKRGRVDELLEKVQTQANRHFDLDPEDCHWGHAGDLGHLIECLEYALGIAHHS